MTLSKRQDGYLNQRIILFRLQYETNSLQMHPKLPCRSVVAPTPKLLEGQYALRLVVVPYRHLPSLLPFFEPISPYPSSHISSVAVPHLLQLRIHPCCPTSPPPCSFADVFAAYIFFHLHYPASPMRLHCHPPASPLRFLLHYIPLSCVLHHRCLSTFLDRIFSPLCIVLYYTASSALLHTTFFALRSDLLTAILFYFLARLFSISVMFSLPSDLPRFPPTYLPSALLKYDQSPQLCLLRSACSVSDMLNYNCSAHALICLLQFAWINSLRYALSFVPLDLLIYVKITHHYVTQHLLLAYTIT